MSNSAQIAVAPLIVDYRTMPRQVVNFAAYVREYKAELYDVRVTDLSLIGCRITCPIELEPETQIWLKIPGLVARRARIAWGRDGQFGCEFVSPFPAGALDAALSEPARKVPRLFS
jgi:hypothetical protein